MPYISQFFSHAEDLKLIRAKKKLDPAQLLAVVQRMIENTSSHAAHTQGKPPLFIMAAMSHQIKAKDFDLVGMSNTQRDWLTVIRVTNS